MFFVDLWKNLGGAGLGKISLLHLPSPPSSVHITIDTLPSHRNWSFTITFTLLGEKMV